MSMIRKAIDDQSRDTGGHIEDNPPPDRQNDSV